MAKAQGPEEFFEVFRKATRRDKAGAEPAAAPPPVAQGGPAPSPPPAPPAVGVPPPAGRAPSAGPARRRFVPSIFAEDRPTITLRRSTLIFSIVIVIILLFIFYALGKRAGRAGAASRAPAANAAHGETRVPAQPDAVRHKCAVVVQVLDHTQEASAANARRYRDFLIESAEAAFVRGAEKQAFILSHRQQLLVCVGPFESLRDETLADVLPGLRTLRFDGDERFRNATVQPIPATAKLMD